MAGILGDAGANTEGLVTGEGWVWGTSVPPMRIWGGARPLLGKNIFA